MNILESKKGEGDFTLHGFLVSARIPGRARSGMTALNKGFTLIELLVVIAIIALLSALVFAALTSAKMKARDASRIATARTLTLALALYEDKNGSVIGINGIPGGSGFSMGAISATTSTSVISVLVNGGYLGRQIAGDATFGVDQYYLGIAPDGRYQVYAKLERQESAMTSGTLAALPGGSGALSSGYNYGHGAGAGAGSAGVVASSTAGGPIPSSTLNLTATPASVIGAQSFTLNWSSTNASSTCTATNGWSGAKSNSGSTTISSIAATTTYTLYCANTAAGGTGATSSAVVGYSPPPVGPPTSFALTQTANNRTFTVSWTAGVGNGGAGGCRLQYQSDASWVNVASPATINCDASTSSLAVSLPAGTLTGVSGNWNNRKLRILRISDSLGVATSTNALACTSKAGSGSPTPSVDEDCNATWDNSDTTPDSCNTCSVTEWSYDYTQTNYNATACGGGVYDSSGANMGGFSNSTSCNSDRTSRFTGTCYNTGGAGPYYSYRYTTSSCTSSSNSVTDCGLCGGTLGSTTYY